MIILNHIDPPVSDLNINKANGGFYKGFNPFVTLASKLIIILLVIWAAVFPASAGELLNQLKSWSFANFGAWYIYVMTFYVLICLAVALIPSFGKMKLGKPDDKPEFSSFSWFSMMFGAGIGIGMLTFATAEPIYHFSSNPDTIIGSVAAQSEETIRSVYKWSFLHWGLSAWGCYALVGLGLAYFSYSRGLPLTIRSGLTPIFGKKLEGKLGHVVDITAVVATILGVAVTIGFGISQFASGLHTLTGAEWMTIEDGAPSTTAMILALVIVMLGSILSALSGVGKGIKWLSNLNMVLSISLLLFFLFFGAAAVAFESFFLGILDYLINFPQQAFTYWAEASEEPAATLYKWQSLWWTVFYWAWWIAFAPFVGLFLARISKGRSIREFIFGAMIVPSLMCFIWFTFVGGTAIDLELSGQAGGDIINAGQESQLFTMLQVMLSPVVAKVMTGLVVILLLTYLITSADSAVLIINTINSGGDDTRKTNPHIIIWGVIITLLIAVLMLAGGLDAIKSAMLIGALPFSLVLALIGISLFTALIQDTRRAKQLKTEALNLKS